MLERLRSTLRLPLGPMTVHELRSRMRNQQSYSVLTLYMLVAGGVTLLVYITASAMGSSGIDDSSRVGSALFYIVVAMQTLLVSFVTPWFSAGALSSEREGHTYDLLRLTLITPRQLVTSKFLSGYGFTGLLVFASLPLLSLALLLGGVDVGQLAAALAVILATGFLFSCLALYISCCQRSTTDAMILTYTTVLGIVIGVSVLTLIALPMLNGVLYRSSTVVRTRPFLAELIQLVQYVLMSCSPISTLAVSETSLLQSGHLLSMTVDPIPGMTTPFNIPAPFLITTLLYLTTGILLLWLTVRHLSRPNPND